VEGERYPKVNQGINKTINYRIRKKAKKNREEFFYIPFTGSALSLSLLCFTVYFLKCREF